MTENVKELLKKYDFILFALMFGSFAKGEPTPLSDLDIGIFTEREIDLFQTGEIIFELETLANRKVDLVILNDLPVTHPLLAFNIVAGHKLLFCSNTKAYSDFKTKSLLFYFDFQPIIKVQNEHLKKRIKNGTFGKAETS